MSNASELLNEYRMNRFTTIGVYLQNPGPMLFKADFRPTSARLDDIATNGNELLKDATDADLDDYKGF